MAEYQALCHYHSKDGDDLGPPPSVDEMGAAFTRMASAGVARVH